MKSVQKIMMTSPNNYKLSHEIKESEDKFIVTVKMEMQKNKYGFEAIEKCFEEQKSPIIKTLGEKEREVRSEIKRGKSIIPLYQKTKNEEKI